MSTLKELKIGDLVKVSYQVENYKRMVQYLASKDIERAYETINQSTAVPFSSLNFKKLNLTTIANVASFRFAPLYETAINNFLGIVIGFFDFESDSSFNVRSVIFFDVEELKYIEIHSAAWNMQIICQESALVV